MIFVSTRGGSPPTSLATALLAGLATDGGLYVPATLPRFVPADFDGDTTLAALATRLLAPFFAGDALAGELDAICAEAFAFDAPLVPTRRADTDVLELFHGPTAAFKDFGARFLASCMQRLHRSDGPQLTILVATSGDTGAAVASAFHRRPGLRVVILYPDGRVSPRQAHQLGCFGDNVQALRVAGNFDDCQRLAKHALNDTSLQARVPLSSANSISLGRLLPQMAYHAQAALTHWRRRRAPLNLVVPTGNLGNALAAILARACGLPIGTIALATNANRVIPDFFAGGEYRPQAGIPTLANAMDVGAPSNFERLRWLHPDAAELRAAYVAAAVDDDAIRAMIATSESRFGHVFCPHTACAARVLADLRARGAEGHWAIVASAHPAKFEQVVEPLIGRALPVPDALARLLGRPTHAEPIEANPDALRAVLDPGRA